jgi:CRISPR system Cascade subunit CasC
MKETTMALFAEVHLIQNFAPSNLNRDDTGAPKDAIFGGVRRARISSQCLKRSVRLDFKREGLLPLEAIGTRTKKLVDELLRRLPEDRRADGEARIRVALSAAGLAVDDKGKTQYLLFLGEREIAGLAELVLANWDALGSIAAPVGAEKKIKKDAKAAVPKEIVDAATTILDAPGAADLALFGRMLADLPKYNVDAACQVAHAISTHKVEREFDYFTAVDDLGAEDETGAGMIGTVEFNSACFYRYAAVDIAKLASNLQGDLEMASAAIQAFIRAAVNAIPSGKQNTFAAHNPPDLVAIALRQRAPRNLANAFEVPVSARRDDGLTTQSVRRLADYERRLSGAYGAAEGWLVLDTAGAWPDDLGTRVPTLDALVEQAAQRIAELHGA